MGNKAGSRIFGRFLPRNTLILFCITAAPVVCLGSGRLYALVGLAVGTAVSFLKMFLLHRMLAAAVYSKNKGIASTGIALIPYAATFLVLAALLVLAIHIDTWAFAGITAGICLVPFAIIVNGITEAAGITNNGFK